MKESLIKTLSEKEQNELKQLPNKWVVILLKESGHNELVRDESNGILNGDDQISVSCHMSEKYPKLRFKRHYLFYHNPK